MNPIPSYQVPTLGGGQKATLLAAPSTSGEKNEHVLSYVKVN